MHTDVNSLRQGEQTHKVHPQSTKTRRQEDKEDGTLEQEKVMKILIPDHELINPTNNIFCQMHPSSGVTNLVRIIPRIANDGL